MLLSKIEETSQARRRKNVVRVGEEDEATRGTAQSHVPGSAGSAAVRLMNDGEVLVPLSIFVKDL